MRALKILIDMDDVLNNLLECWVAELNRRYGLDVVVDNVVEWDMTKAFPTLTPEQVFEPLFLGSFWEKQTPTEGSLETIQQMKADGHDVKIVTATHYLTVAYKIVWLLKFYPCLEYGDIIISQDKSLIAGDVIIDDAAHNLLGNHPIKILIDKPHNQNFDGECIRVKNLKEAYSVIMQYANSINKETNILE